MLPIWNCPAGTYTCLIPKLSDRGEPAENCAAVGFFVPTGAMVEGAAFGDNGIGVNVGGTSEAIDVGASVGMFVALAPIGDAIVPALLTDGTLGISTRKPKVTRRRSGLLLTRLVVRV